MLTACDGNSNSNSNSDASKSTTPTSVCLWNGPFSRENEEQNLNFGFLDDGAVYWLALYAIPEEGAHITLEGEFPYAR